MPHPSTDRIAELEARVEQLRSALKPFAEAFWVAQGSEPTKVEELALMRDEVKAEHFEAAYYAHGDHDPQPREPERL